ncbi:hypothetical protein P154DRAFT_520039 [Amniculicola lignicola CBS 123094]|uniref:Probable double zinc ribbon domain-containing protein n=1 Tax=Amniculicola lignicola CBS 123094 TaxID=1392246 RepID=A0A6A5WNB0_9PLEO|nr:hypothetical protein P154DRAFT_520039 [Amniculicola lignicola CBS 123094]
MHRSSLKTRLRRCVESIDQTYTHAISSLDFLPDIVINPSKALRNARPRTWNLFLTSKIPKLRKRLLYVQDLELQKLIPVDPLPSSAPRPAFFRGRKRLPDGCWTCRHCTYGNTLVVLPCRHPLGYLICSECKRPWDIQCPTTDTMRFFASPDHSYQIDPSLVDTKMLRLGYICENCGLTWRAKALKLATRWEFGFPKTRCVCGEVMLDRMGRDWERQRIGSNWRVFALPGWEMGGLGTNGELI